MVESLAVIPREEILRRIRGEYQEMPGLCLTSAQAQRLWGLDRPLCVELLDALTAEGFLCRRVDGAYARTSAVQADFPRARMIKTRPPESRSQWRQR